MPRLHQKDLSKVRAEHHDKKIVFCSGVFDLTHPGHILFFEDCRKHGDVLVVGVGSDSVIKRDKGDLRPILNEQMRLKMVENLRPVDYAFIIEPLVVKETLDQLKPIFADLRPDVYIMNADASNIAYRKQMLGHLPLRIVVLDRTCPPEYDAVSTSTLIEKIKKLY